MKKIYKYATGDVIPEGAIYLSTVTQTLINQPVKLKDKYIGTSMMSNEPQYQEQYEDQWVDCWLVWHYFLVEDNKK